MAQLFPHISSVVISKAVKMNGLLVICLSLLLVQMCSGYRMLLVFPMGSRSHMILGEEFARHLRDAGHEITLITGFRSKMQGIKQIVVSENVKEIETDIMQNVDVVKNLNSFGKASSFQAMHAIAKNTVSNGDVQALLRDTNVNFDVVVAEWMFNEIYSGFASVFNCPLIWSSSMDPHSMVLHLIDDYPNPAYTADNFSYEGPPFSFYQRAFELFQLLNMIFLKWMMHSSDAAEYERAFSAAAIKRGRILSSFDEAKYNASLMFGNSHPVVGTSISLPQKYVPILGYHIEEDVPKLSQDLQKIMDASTNGVIYFSLGSIVKSKTISLETRKMLLEKFGILSQTVIWKFEETIPDVPKNVVLLNWAPQQSILAHPNCVLFITHGGLLSTTEALHYGVPMIGIPMFADQYLNVHRSMGIGIAKKVDFDEAFPINLKKTIDEILSNKSYHQRMKYLSQVYHDRPVSPGKELVHWVEHVVRTGGAPHLRSPALMVPWYQKLYLDLLTLILVLLIICFYYINKLLVKLRNKDVDKKNK